MSSFKNMDRLLRKLESLGGDTTKALERAVDITIAKAAATARDNAPASKYSQADSDGGASLKSSIVHERTNSTNGAEGRVFSNAGHAVYVEFGTGRPGGKSWGKKVSPHVAVSYTLRSSWAYPIIIGGKKTFRVTSGQPARPFMYPTAVQMKRPFKEITKNVLKVAIHNAAGGTT